MDRARGMPDRTATKGPASSRRTARDMGHIEAAPSAPVPRPWTEPLADARDWARGRFWPAYAVLLAILVYIEVLKLRDVTRWTIFYGITLGFHEMGHLAFAWAPHF